MTGERKIIMDSVLVEKLAMIGFDIASDILIDMANRYASSGVTAITPKELLAEAIKIKSLRAVEIEKVKARMGTDTEGL